MSARITLLSYNICHGEGMDGRIDLSRAAAVISRIQPDYVALQEVDQMTQRSSGADQMHVLESLTGYKSFFGKSLDFQGGGYGIGILSRYASCIQEIHFALPGAEPRSLLAVRSSTSDDRPFLFCCTHLALEEDARLQSAELVSAWVRSQSIPVVLMGDFNCRGTSECYRQLTSIWGTAWTAEPQKTFPSPAPTVDIDHVFFYPMKAWRIVSAEVIDERVASDHRPLKVVLEL